jgi:chromosome segregation ATPase
LEEQTKQVIEKAKAQGGYMVSSDIDRVTIRIPAAKLNSFMDEIAIFGEVESRNVYSQDITDEYADMGIRLDNAEKARKRYLELLEKATDVSDILAIEKELERLNGETERLKGQINSYDKQVKYSSVNVYFIEKVKPGPVGYIFVGLYKAVKFLFVRG